MSPKPAPQISGRSGYLVDPDIRIYHWRSSCGICCTLSIYMFIQKKSDRSSSISIREEMHVCTSSIGGQPLAHILIISLGML